MRLAGRLADDAKYRLRDNTIDRPGDFVLPRHRAVSYIALVFAAGLCAVLGGCKNSAGVFEDKNEGGWFSKPIDVFAKPDWARPVSANVANLDNRGPVGPDDLVGADGRCSPVAAQTQAEAQAPPPAAPAAAPPAAPAATPPAPGNAAAPPPNQLVPADAGAPPVLGGIALGMTECQAVQRAGMPGNVSISAGEKGERQVVLTYISGPWPGIYHFNDGRLKEIDRAPAPPEPVKPAPKKKKTTKKKPAAAKTSQRSIEVVQ